MVSSLSKSRRQHKNEVYQLTSAVMNAERLTVASRYLEIEGTLRSTSRYPYFDISDLQNSGKYQSNNQISQKNMQFDSFS